MTTLTKIANTGRAIITWMSNQHFTEKQLAVAEKAISDLLQHAENGTLADCVHVSTGNKKIGKMVNFSLMTGYTCGAIAGKTCHKCGCYAKKENRYTAVLYNRIQNSIIAIHFPELIPAAIDKAVKKSKVNVIRLHEAGDFVTDEYLKMLAAYAAERPELVIYTYTKQYKRIIRNAAVIPSNMQIKISTWPGLPLDAKIDIATLYGKGFFLAGLDNDDTLTATVNNDRVHACLNQIDGRNCTACNLCMVPCNVTFKKH